MSEPESREQQALRIVSENAVRVFERVGATSVANAAAMVALGAIASGDPFLARKLFEQAQSLTPEAEQEAALLAWALWTVEADNGPAAVALAKMGIDWHEAQAPYSNYARNLGQELMRSTRGEAVQALMDSGDFDPLRPTRNATLVSSFGSRKWLAWAALNAQDNNERAGSFKALLANPRVKADQESLDGALWAILQYPDHKAQTGAVARALLEAGANPFKKNAIGERCEHEQAKSFGKDAGLGRWSQSFVNPLLELGDAWFSAPEREAAAARAAQWVSYATLKNQESELFAAAQKETWGEHRAGEGWLSSDKEQQLKTQTKALWAKKMAQENLSDTIERLRRGEWPERVLEKDWDIARDLIANASRAFGDSRSLGQHLWSAAATAIDWSLAPGGEDGAGIVGFLMCQRKFAGGRQASPMWDGREMLQTLLDAGASIQSKWPERDPKELAAACAMAGNFGPFRVLSEHWEKIQAPETLSSDTLSRAGNFLSENAAQQLARLQSKWGVKISKTPDEIAEIKNLGAWAASAAVATRWTKFVEGWAEAMAAIHADGEKPEAQSALNAHVERLRLMAEGIRAPELILSPNQGEPAPAARSAMRL